VCSCEVRDEAKRCPRCDTPHHPDCWAYVGGCAIFGCDAKKWKSSGDITVVNKLKSRLRIWRWLFQVQWMCFSVLALTFTNVILLLVTRQMLTPILVALLRGSMEVFVVAIARTTDALSFIGIWLVLVALLGYIFVAIPERFVRWRLERYLGVSLAIPSQARPASLVQSLEGIFAARMHAWATKCTRWFANVSLAVLVPFYVYMVLLMSGWGFLSLLLIPIVIIRFACIPVITSASNARMAYVEAVRNRMIATFSKSKG